MMGKKKGGKKERVGNFLAFKTRTPIKFKIKKADTHSVSIFFFFKYIVLLKF